MSEKYPQEMAFIHLYIILVMSGYGFLLFLFSLLKNPSPDGEVLPPKPSGNCDPKW